MLSRQHHGDYECRRSVKDQLLKAHDRAGLRSGGLDDDVLNCIDNNYMQHLSSVLPVLKQQLCMVKRLTSIIQLPQAN
jgi:hypothetical protein